MPAHSGNSAAPLERRLHVRQRINSIVYVDIGLDNGGIVLNLSEEGLAFQAVGPLGKHGELRIKIKLPSSQARIELPAQIAWVSNSNRQAGVRFLEARPEYQVQIQEWVRSLAPAPAAREEASNHEAEEAVSPPKQETSLELLTDKRISLAPEIAEPDLRLPEPSEASGNGMRPEVQTDPTDSAGVRKDEIASQPFAEAANSLLAEFRAVEDRAAQPAAIQNPSAQTREAPDGGDSPIAVPSPEKSSDEPALSWPAPISRTAELALPRSQTALPDALELFTPAVDSKTNTAPASATTIFDIPEPANKPLTRNRLVIATLLVLCSVLCFAIGTWIGQIVTRRNLLKTATAPVNLVRTADAGVKGKAGGSAGKPTLATSEKVHTRAASGHRAIDARKAEPSTDSLGVLAMRQSAESDSQVQTVTAYAATKEQQSSPPVATATENSNAPGQNAAPFAVTKGQESNPAVALAPENSAPAAPSPRIIGGLVLKPSDRFNPCYLAYRVEAEYPPEAQKQRIEGVVKIQQVVGVDGKVRGVKLLSGPPLLAPAALEAARYWRYLPALLNGQPVETEQDIEIAFQLPN